MDPFNLVVTEELIARGRRSPAHCPIALALKAAGKIDPNVGGDFAAWTEPATLDRVQAELPEAAVEFVKRFDGRRPVGPLEFVLNPRHSRFDFHTEPL